MPSLSAIRTTNLSNLDAPWKIGQVRPSNARPVLQEPEPFKVDTGLRDYLHIEKLGKERKADDEEAYMKLTDGHSYHPSAPTNRGIPRLSCPGSCCPAEWGRNYARDTLRARRGPSEWSYFGVNADDAADDKKVYYYVTRQPNILVGGKNYRVKGLQYISKISAAFDASASFAVRDLSRLVLRRSSAQT